jgi:peptidoglycan/LPS O-acetylase OafA/YrhL
VQQSNQIQALTSLRGIAAIWVMLFHVDVFLFYKNYGALLNHDASGIITKGYLWVDFFFILSGFVISLAYQHKFVSWATIKLNFISYLKSRWLRIYPLHFFTLALLVAAYFVLPLLFADISKDGSWQTFFAPSAIVDNLLLIHAMNQHVYLSWNIVSWSIAAEWWVYIAAVPLIFLAQQKTWITIAQFIIFASSIYFFFAHFKTLDVTFNYGWLRCLSEFGLGIIAYNVYKKSFVAKVFSSDVLSGLLLCTVIITMHYAAADILIVPQFMLLILCIAHNKSIVSKVLNSKVLKYLGNISYSIYMMHGFWFMLCWFVLPNITSFSALGHSPILRVCFAVIFCIVTIISSHFTYKYIELKFVRKR